jgi:farnesyl diphosphate synthase
MPTTLKEFESVFPTLVNDMKEHCQKYKLPEQALTWFEKVCRIGGIAVRRTID